MINAMAFQKLLLLLPLLLSGTGVGDQALTGKPLEEARAAISRLAQKLEGVERMHANFIQEQHTMLMAEPLVSKGRLSLRGEPGCLVLELKEPQHAILRSDATSHQVYYPAKKRAERYLFKSNELAKTLLSILTVDVTQIEKVFQITGKGSDELETFLELRLRDEKKRRIVDHLRILISAKSSKLAGVSFVNSDGEKTVLRLSEMRYISQQSTAQERSKEEQAFDVPLPKDVQLVVHSISSDD
jgi:outer membrane lipoprotein-sorting protein